jgi:DNA helicase-2/ATP-dependent DNA helicase PcrA
MATNLDTAGDIESLLHDLNKQQREAVSLKWGPALIIAGAGSGKTTVLMRRIAYLLSQLKQDPFSIMAVTFTNKAASQMKQRVGGLLQESLTRSLSIGTFHSICASILRREINSYRGLDDWQWSSNFVIYDEVDSLSLVKGVISSFNLDEKLFAPRDIRQSISSLKNEGTTAKKFAESAKGYRETRIGEIFYAYQQELARNNALDFDDLILLTVELLRKNDEVRGRLQSRYRHLLIDEFQDTNKSQYELVRLLTTASWEGRSLMVVGDVDQSIYSWRKADFRIILGFQKDFPGSTLIKLEENYRSTSTILEVANSVICNNAERIEKVLRCNRGQGSKVNCRVASDEIDEAYFVVEKIKEYVASGHKLSGCAVLYRTNAQSRAIEEILVRSHMPYSMVGATRFYDRQEIKDVIAYLRLVFNTQDGQSFLRAVNQPRRGIGKTTLERLTAYSNGKGLSYTDACKRANEIPALSAKVTACLSEFANTVERWQMLSNKVSLSALVELVLQESGYLDALAEESGSDPTAQGRIDNLREFLGVAREFEESADEANLETFLTRVSLVSDLDAVELSNETVKLMTIHSAKGLEFDNVFIMGLEDGLFPHFRSLNSPSALEEERRLMYVAVTRAADRLHLSYARRRIQFSGAFTGTTSYTIPSRFLKEIDINLLQGYYPEPETPSSYENSSYEGGTRSRRGYERVSLDDEDWGETSWTKKPRAMRLQPPTAAAEETFAPTPVLSVSQQANFKCLSPGTIVQHAKFGTGKLLQVIGDPGKELYNIEFEQAGKRLLDPRFAKLIVLSE